MKYRINEKRFYLLTYIVALGFPAIASADATDSGGEETGVEIEFFSMGNSNSSIGNAQVGTSGVLIEAEYENNDISFSFNYERWRYDWTNPENLPFVSSTASAPWVSFNTLQFGLAYEQAINPQWELRYYAEAESSFEEQTSGSREYEIGIDFTYELSKNWIYTVNTNYEYLTTEFKVNKFITSFEYLNENNTYNKESYLANTSSYTIDDSNSLSFGTRLNKKTRLTEFYNIIYQYKNDCLAAAIEYKKDYYSDKDLKPEENIFFKLTITPLGGFNTPNLMK